MLADQDLIVSIREMKKKLARHGRDHSFTKEDSAVLEYEFKLKHIKNKMLTKRGEQLAKERHKIMKKFMDRFWLEIEGIK